MKALTRVGILRKRQFAHRCSIHSFAYSGCGWLTTFHFGVTATMIENGYITEKSIFGGTSGGSLAALIASADISPEKALEIVFALSEKDDLLVNVDKELRTVLTSIVTDDVVHKCNGRLFVTVTEAMSRQNFKGKVLSQFDSPQQLVDILCASCFIPVYSARKLVTRIEGYPGQFLDGGVRNFMPPVGDIKVTPFPYHPIVKKILGRQSHIALPPKKFSVPQLMFWALKPAPRKVLTELYEEGRRAADFYIDQHRNSLNKI